MDSYEIKTVLPGEINGRAKAPASKSMMIREVAAIHLSGRDGTIKNPSYCDDGLVSLRIAGGLGSQIEKYTDRVEIKVVKPVTKATLNCGESGLSIRMFPPVAAVRTEELTFNAEGSLQKRPIGMMLEPLKDLGLSVETTNNFAPLQITGRLKGGETTLDGSQSSQFLSGLLMSLPLVDENSVLHVQNLKSIPYIDMTLEVMKKHGIHVEHADYRVFNIEGRQQYNKVDCDIEGDWSGAAFLLVAGAIGGKIRVKGLDVHSAQADRKILDALGEVGAGIHIASGNISVERNDLHAFDMDITHCPDLAPPLVVLAANCDGISRLKGVSRLLAKESNRASGLQKEFANLDIEIEIKSDEMLIHGGNITGGTFHAQGDHRMAMAGAIAALTARGPVKVTESNCVSKSYPGFFNDFINIGGVVK